MSLKTHKRAYSERREMKESGATRWTPAQVRALEEAKQTRVLEHTTINGEMDRAWRGWCEEEGWPCVRIARKKRTGVHHVGVDFSTIGAKLDDEMQEQVHRVFLRHASERSTCVVEEDRVTAASMPSAGARSFAQEVVFGVLYFFPDKPNCATKAT